MSDDHDDGGVGGKPVGYRSPPRSGQFKKGQSGNPMGRPRKSRTTREALESALARNINLAIDGRRKRMPVRDALSLKLIQGALAGDPKSTIALMKMAKDWEREDDRARMVAEAPRKQTPEEVAFNRLLATMILDLHEIAKILVGAGAFVALEGNRVRVARWFVDLLIGHSPDRAAALTFQVDRLDYVTDEIGLGKLADL